MVPIAKLQVKRVQKLVEDRGNFLEVSDAAIALLAQHGYDPQYGARPLKRVVQDYLQDAVADLVIGNALEPGQTVVIDCEGEGLSVDVRGLADGDADAGADGVDDQAPGEEPEKDT